MALDGHGHTPTHLLRGADDTYELSGRMTTGGMAELYFARSCTRKQLVVIKRILPHLLRDAEFVRMFRDEAYLARMLEHPCIVRVHDVGLDDSALFFAMEYVHGASLRDILEAQSKRRRHLPWRHFFTIAKGLISALHYAHELRDETGQPLDVVHRDVSPTNVLVDYGGAIKLLDFGIAKAKAATHITQAGMLKGKTAYMSPEQCRSEPVDRRSDIFALGIVLYEMSTLSRLFHGTTDMTIMNRILEGKILPPSSRRADYPAVLETIVMRCLALDPAARYPSADKLLADLGQAERTMRLPQDTNTLGSYVAELTGRKPFPTLQPILPPSASGAFAMQAGSPNEVPGPARRRTMAITARPEPHASPAATPEKGGTQVARAPQGWLGHPQPAAPSSSVHLPPPSLPLAASPATAVGTSPWADAPTATTQLPAPPSTPAPPPPSHLVAQLSHGIPLESAEIETIGHRRRLRHIVAASAAGAAALGVVVWAFLHADAPVSTAPNLVRDASVATTPSEVAAQPEVQPNPTTPQATPPPKLEVPTAELGERRRYGRLRRATKRRRNR